MKTLITIEKIREYKLDMKVWSGVVEEYKIQISSHTVLSCSFNEDMRYPNQLSKVSLSSSRNYNSTIYVFDNIKYMEQLELIYEGFTGKSFSDLKKVK